MLTEEILIRKTILKDILKDHGYDNSTACVKEWKKNGLLDYEKDRSTRSRVIVPGGGTEDVYALQIYAEPTAGTTSVMINVPAAQKQLLKEAAE